MGKEYVYLTGNRCHLSVVDSKLKSYLQGSCSILLASRNILSEVLAIEGGWDVLLNAALLRSEQLSGADYLCGSRIIAPPPTKKCCLKFRSK